MQTVTEGFEITRSEQLMRITEESLSYLTITAQSLAGSLVLSSTYHEVVFSSCVFYGCNFDGVVFKNCKFEQCIFEFAHFKNCTFENCTFSDCTWGASSTRNCKYLDCELDTVLSGLTEMNTNFIEFSFAELMAA